MSTGLKKKLNKQASSFKPTQEEQEQQTQGGELPGHEIPRYLFVNEFDRLDNYLSLEEIKEKFLPLREINEKLGEFNRDKAFFFNIQSNSLDDIHKALKYGIWTSSKKVNESLIAAYH